MHSLTEKQQRILVFIEAFARREGMAPTVSEIAAHFEVKGATAFAHLRALQRKGYIKRSKKARSLSLTRTTSKSERSGLTLSVPILGRISAGAPLMAEEHVEGQVVVDPKMLPRGAGGHRLFALTVIGESMRDLGILDGDTVIAKQTPAASIGDVVVASVDNETTVKSLYIDGNQVELRPANSAYQSQYYDLEAVSIQGVVVGLQRIF